MCPTANLDEAYVCGGHKCSNKHILFWRQEISVDRFIQYVMAVPISYFEVSRVKMVLVLLFHLNAMYITSIYEVNITRMYLYGATELLHRARKKEKTPPLLIFFAVIIRKTVISLCFFWHSLLAANNSLQNSNEPNFYH